MHFPQRFIVMCGQPYLPAILSDLMVTKTNSAVRVTWSLLINSCVTYSK